MHEGERQQARFVARRRAPKRHDLEHGFWHEGENQKARFCARGRAPKSSI